jgi:hypothetical protein
MKNSQKLGVFMKDQSDFKYVIAFQKNRLGRDYVYELSTAYLFSRSIHGHINWD